MDEKKIGKAASLAISAIIISLSFYTPHDWRVVGIHSGCGLLPRVLYPFFHVNALHAALNAWCLLSVVFIHNLSIWRVAAAYMLSITIPAFCLSPVPTVGLSGMVFALFGSISFSVARKLYYQSWMLFYLIAGFLFPGTNAWIHLYCYMAGCLVALLNKPIKTE